MRHASLITLLLILLPATAIAATFNDVADGPWNGCETWGICPGAVEGTESCLLVSEIVR
jgi:hypothetical protein